MEHDQETVRGFEAVPDRFPKLKGKGKREGGKESDEHNIHAMTISGGVT